MPNSMESFHAKKEVPENNKNEDVSSNPDLYYKEVDSQTQSIIDAYNNIEKNNSLSDSDKKEQLDSIKSEIVSKINSFEGERGEIWKEIDTNEGYPDSEAILENDSVKQLTTNINELSKLLNPEEGI